MTVELVSHNLLQFVLISFIFKSWDTDMEFVTSAFSYMYTLCPFSFLLFPFFIMRKVEQQMNEAILNRKDFCKGNTSVENYITDYARYQTIIDCVGHPGDQ